MGMVYYVLCILYSVACILYPVFGDRRRKEGGDFRGEGETENRRLLTAQPRRPAFLITEPPPPLPLLLSHTEYEYRGPTKCSLLHIMVPREGS